ncbi:thioredoxin domain-containing protein [Sphingomonas changnyeongensis]|uniref:Thioredoxin domain-containing protein n=1 Tax=Sphingomonas changnyeongensis TaxID=2698679 RepID=A0A7Z2S4D7_9SPHN|nr:thioredoxin domain-containing protein [Sphingomonas changnyeongensis]QHL89955.1 thioredoxin domain-containing protein [Sphingomonas changnyeongensis]
MRFALMLGAAALALSACSQSADNGSAPANGTAAAPATGGAAIPPPAGKEWSDVVTALPEGGMRMGNPDAPVKLVEYLSLTCPHCAEFAREGFEKLRDQYVKKGTVSLEVRNYVRDPIDMTLTLVSRCGGPEPYFAMTEQALATQNEIFDRAQKADQAAVQALQSQAPAQQFQGLARLLGFDAFARQRGIAEARLDQCLADKAMTDQLIAMQKTANDELKIPGTPAFFLNGQLLEATGTWEQLEPKLKAAGA